MPTPHAAAITSASFTGFDWFLAIVVTVSTLLAFRRGIVLVLLSLAGLVVGTLLASWYYTRLGGWLHGMIPNPKAAQAVAFLAILMAVWVVFSVAAGLVRKAVRAVGLGLVDRLLGAGFGLARGVLLGVVAMMALTAFDPHSGWIRNSVLTPYFLHGVDAVCFVVPQHFREQMSEGTRYLVEKTPGVLKPHTPER